VSHKHGFLSSEISSGVEEILGEDSRVAKRFRFTRKERGNAVIVTTNIYLRKKSQFPEFVSHLASIVKSIIENHIGLNGEIIRLDVEGGVISDRGETWFEVIGGVVFEVYCFTCRSISFVRILHEKQLYGEKNEWISLDVDEYRDLQWFEE